MGQKQPDNLITSPIRCELS